MRIKVPQTEFRPCRHCSQTFEAKYKGPMAGYTEYCKECVKKRVWQEG